MKPLVTVVEILDNRRTIRLDLEPRDAERIIGRLQAKTQASKIGLGVGIGSEPSVQLDTAARDERDAVQVGVGDIDVRAAVISGGPLGS